MQLRAQAGPQLRALRRSTKRLRGGSCRSEVRKQKLRRRLLSSGAWKNNQEVSRNRQIHQRSETIKLKLCWLPNLPPRIWESDAGEEPFTRQPGKKKKSYSSGNSFTSSVQIRTGLSLAFPTKWKGTEPIACNCCYVPPFFHPYTLSHLFKKEL